MAAYFKSSLQQFVDVSANDVAAKLSQAILERFAGNQREQLKSWQDQITLLQFAFREVLRKVPRAAHWGVLLEYPLLRLQRRLDTVALAGQLVAVIEFKVGATAHQAADVRQVEDYALDLRDFHYESRRLTIVPVLCATDAPTLPLPEAAPFGTVWPVTLTNAATLADCLRELAELPQVANSSQLKLEEWDGAPYRPVPTIIEAAELLYAGHAVEEIARAAADVHNLERTCARLVEIVAHARNKKRQVVCFVTGVPGSGKTLTGLNLVHDKRLTNSSVNAAYLSGNTPLVEVLREALARDRARRLGEPLRETRRVVRTEIQHLMDYLREYITENPTHCPFENVIVFDEAQRAWDAAYGKRKFGREASEPALFLEIMARQAEWAVIVALVGGGQEINVGEGGLGEWGKALAAWAKDASKRGWDVVAAPDVVFGGSATLGQAVFEHGYAYPGEMDTDGALHLSVAVRNYRCDAMSAWVDHALAGHVDVARKLANSTTDLPVFVTRDLLAAKAHLRAEGRGNRRVGLVASSGARRLRADGLGVTLSANERDAYVHWYLEARGDIRSSNALEVTANEYTCQGLELDYVGVCWGGDMLWNPGRREWTFRELHGPRWKSVKSKATETYIRNTYRVLMTRARLGIVIWVPQGDLSDATREPAALDETAALLRAAGAKALGVSAPMVPNQVLTPTQLSAASKS